MNKLTLVIITLNEEKNIERCIRSVPFADEIVVVDSGSTDRTIEIAKSLGAKVYTNEWPGYGAQKDFASKKTTGDWILSLDADEWLSQELAEEIQEVLKSFKTGVFSFPRLSYFLGKKIKHGGWFPDKQIRLYSKGGAEWNPEESIHESLKTNHAVRQLKGLLYHEPFDSIKEQVDVNFIYSGLLAEKKFKSGRRIKYPFWIVFKTLFKFIENYIFKAGFMDGTVGFIIAYNSAQSYMIQLYKIYLKGRDNK